MKKQRRRETMNQRNREKKSIEQRNSLFLEMKINKQACCSLNCFNIIDFPFFSSTFLLFWIYYMDLLYQQSLHQKVLFCLSCFHRLVPLILDIIRLMSTKLIQKSFLLFIRQCHESAISVY